MDIKAQQKFIITSPRKLSIVTNLVKHLSPLDAYKKLPFVKKRAAGYLRKVIGTALANAKQVGIQGENLVFKEIQINQGPGLKRHRAGARGRAKPYKKRMSHIRVILTTKEKETPKTKDSKNKKTIADKKNTKSK